MGENRGETFDGKIDALPLPFALFKDSAVVEHDGALRYFAACEQLLAELELVGAHAAFAHGGSRE